MKSFRSVTIAIASVLPMFVIVIVRTLFSYVIAVSMTFGLCPFICGAEPLLAPSRGC